jgi:hypothetical protein
MPSQTATVRALVASTAGAEAGLGIGAMGGAPEAEGAGGAAFAEEAVVEGALAAASAGMEITSPSAIETSDDG